jgi:CubicO group peptidase (beta-lactamase class C family)
MSVDTSVTATRRTDAAPRRRRWLPTFALLLGVITVAGWWAATSTVDDIETIGPGLAVSAVDIDVTAGAVHLEIGEEVLVEVERRSGRGSGDPSVTSAVIDGVLHVTGRCPRIGIGRCTTDVNVTLPREAAVDLKTGAGPIAGVVANGPLTATTAAGSVTLTVIENVDELAVSTGAGSIDLTVPDVTYQVSARTSLGRTRIEVETASGAVDTISARSEVGNVTIRTGDSTLGTATTPSLPTASAVASQASRDDGPVPASPDLDTPGDLESFLDQTMAGHLERFDLAGAAVTVVRDGEVVVAKGYGHADLEKGTAVDAGTTVFPTASVSKLFTWTALMQLVERGQLDLDAEVNDLLRGFQLPDEFDEPVRVWHLLSHTAGFEDKPMSLAVTPADLTDLETSLVRDMPSQDWEPGRYTAYNNYGAGLAGHLVAEVSGLSWEDYLDRNILEPLEMTRTSGSQPTPDMLPDGMTKVYRRLGDGLVEADHEIVALAPFGGMVSTARDMANFMIAHLQDGRFGEHRILQEATARQMHSRLFTHDPRSNGNAHGFWESTEHGQRVLSHLGDHNTSMAGLWLLPDRDLGIYVTYNSDRGGEARTALWDAFLDHTFPPTDSDIPSEPVTISTQDLERFEGSYGSSRISSSTPGKLFLLLGAMTVSADEGDLITRVAGFEPTRWVATGDDAFVSADGRSRMVSSSEAGQPPYLAFDGPSTSAYSPMDVWVATPWYDRVSLHGGLFAISLALILSTLTLWPALALVRHRRGSTRPDRGSIARWWAAVTGGLYLLFVVLLLASLLDFLALEFGASPMLLAALSVGVAAAVMTLGAVIHTLLAWQNGYWSVAARIHYTLVAVAFVSLSWQLDHWNLLGFHA